METTKQNTNIQLRECKDSYKLIIPERVEKMIREWCSLSPNNEWSGTLFYTIEGSFENKDLVLTAQDFYVSDIGTAGFTRYKVTPEICNYMIEHDLLDCKTGLIHSHDTMNAFFSGTDSDTLKEEGIDSCHYLSLVVCNRGPYVARITRRVKEIIEGVRRVSYPSYDDTIIESTEEVNFGEKEVVEYYNLSIEVEGPENSVNAEILARFKELSKSPTAFKNASWQTQAKRQTVGGVVVPSYFKSSPANPTAHTTMASQFHVSEEEEEVPQVRFQGNSLPKQPTLFDKEKETQKEETQEEEQIDDTPSFDFLDSLSIDNKEAVEIAAQLLYGNITLTYEAFQKFTHIDKWIKENMEKVFNRRFGDTEEGFKVYQEWMYDFCDIIIWNSAYFNVDKLKLKDRDSAAYVVASSVINVINDLFDKASDSNPDVEIKMNPYISYIIECLEGFIYK